MSSLSKLPRVVGFFSYSRDDDALSNGRLSSLRQAIYGELSGELGLNSDNFRLFQDKEAIAYGERWDKEIAEAINEAVFFIPIVSPRTLVSRQCKMEFDSFLAREGALARENLIFPILYRHVPELKDNTESPDDSVLAIIRARQYADWRELRHLPPSDLVVSQKIEHFCRNIASALREPWPTPEQRRRQEEFAARQRVEEERKRREADAKKQAEEEVRRKQKAALAKKAEEKRKAAEAAAARRSEEERRKQEKAEAQRRAAQEQRRLRDAAEAKAHAEEDVRGKRETDRLAREARQKEEAEAVRRADEERNVAAEEVRQRNLPQMKRNLEVGDKSIKLTLKQDDQQIPRWKSSLVKSYVLFILCTMLIFFPTVLFTTPSGYVGSVYAILAISLALKVSVPLSVLFFLFLMLRTPTGPPSR